MTRGSVAHNLKALEAAYTSMLPQYTVGLPEMVKIQNCINREENGSFVLSLK